jgi:3-methylfumaryl-CoA hydratase
MDSLREWVGNTCTTTAVIEPGAVDKLSATLDHEAPLATRGEAIPPCWHWLYFHDVVPAARIGPDGHPQRGDFLPPVPLPRRMWAGGRLRYHRPVLVGDRVSLESRIDSVEHKRGSSGELVFVNLMHRYCRDDELLLEEEQRLVYRGPARAGATATPVADQRPADFARDIEPDPVLLFRYSALTFNSHRIHYDRDYARDVEGYDGLVVQGPLTATLLLDLLYREMPGCTLLDFEFRGVAPLLDTGGIRLHGCRDGSTVELWATGPGAVLAMTARATLADARCESPG